MAHRSIPPRTIVLIEPTAFAFRCFACEEVISLQPRRLGAQASPGRRTTSHTIVSMPITDAELLEKARTGDSSAVDEILARHERQVFRFGLRMCGNEEDAREVLQETL